MKEKRAVPIWLTSLLLLLFVAGCAPAGNATQEIQATAADTAAVTPTTAASAIASSSQDIPATGATVTATAEGVGKPETNANGAIRFDIVPAESEARYRVREQLVNFSLPNDAVGKTKEITGAIVIQPDGTIDAASSKFVVDLTNITSDQSRRDTFVKRNVLRTDTYPTAVFIPKKISGLSNPLPQSGQVSFQLTGDLTLLDVTKEVTWDVTGTVENGKAVGQAKTRFTFEDFNLTRPQVPVVLSIEDHIDLELDLTLQQAAGQGASSNVIPQTAPTNEQTAQVDQEVPQDLTCTAPAKLTPALTEGPYFKAGSPEETTLLQPGMSGTKLNLSGYVVTSDCQPVAHALLEFWQADAKGQYDNSGYTLRGHQYTDASGRYHLETVVPGLYPGRTMHLHVKVQAPGGPVLTTQLFFPGEMQNNIDNIFESDLLVNSQTTPGGMKATYNFVVSTQ